MEHSVLVTGGAGFLGSHLCDRLVENGHDVLCADNFFTGNRRNVAHLLETPGFELLRHDITFPLYVEVTRIFNFACPATPSIINSIPCRRRRRVFMARSTCLGWRSASKLESFRHLRVKCTGIPKCIPSLRHTGAESILSVCAHVTTKASAALRLCFSTITDSTISRSKSCGSSILTGRACIQMTGAW